MPVSFRIPGPLRAYTGGCDTVVVEASPRTVGEALAALTALHPGLRDRVLTEEGVVRPHVNVFVGEESIRHTGGLMTTVGDGDEVSIIAAVSGG